MESCWSSRAAAAMRLWADAVHALGWHGRTRGRVLEAVEKYPAPVERYHATPLADRIEEMLAGGRTLPTGRGVPLTQPGACAPAPAR